MSRAHLSASCWRALADAVAAACVELHEMRQNAPIMAGDEHPQNDTRALVRECVDDIVSAFLRSLNEAASSFACRLPAEVLCSAFSYLDLADRITATHVCQAWRDVSLAAPAQLWSVISVDSRPGILAARLARCGSVPLQLHIYVHPDNVAEVCFCLHSAWDHIQTLCIRLDKRLSGAQMSAVASLLAKAAPTLTELTLVDITWTVCDSNWASLLDGHSPLLRVLKVDLGQDALTSTRSWTSVTHLALRVVSGTSRLLAWMFSSFPSLEACALEMLFWEPEGEASVAHQHPLSLRTLAIRISDSAFGAAMAQILPYLFHATIPTIIINYYYAADPDDIAALVSVLAPSALVQSATVHFSTSGIHAVNLTTHHALGRQRMYLDVPQSITQQAALFSSLASLAISEMMLLPLGDNDEGSPLPEMPALQHLEVLAVFPWSHLIRTWCSVLLCDDDCEWVLVCPALRHVSFRARLPLKEDLADYPGREDAMGRVPTILSPAAVVRFLRQKLRYASAKLQTITFAGVEATTHVIADVAELLEMADELVCDPARSEDVASLGLDVYDLLDVDSHKIFGFRDSTLNSDYSQSDDGSVASDD